MRRSKMSRGRNRRNFRSGNYVHPKNAGSRMPMRGGIRL